jgi:hypothetical protein
VGQQKDKEKSPLVCLKQLPYMWTAKKKVFKSVSKKIQLFSPPHPERLLENGQYHVSSSFPCD